MTVPATGAGGDGRVPWREWTELQRVNAGVAPHGLDLLPFSPCRVALAAWGRDGSVRACIVTDGAVGSEPGGWTTVSESSACPPALVTGPAGSPAIVHVDGDSHVNVQVLDGDSRWGEPVVLPDDGHSAAPPVSLTLASWGAGHADAFVVQSDGVVRQRHMLIDDELQVTGDWVTIAEGARQLAPLSWAPRRLDLFTTSAEGFLRHKWWDDSPDRFDVFLARSGARTSNRWWPPGYGWLPATPCEWETLSGGIVSTPAVVSWGPFHLDAFAVGMDGQLLHLWWNPDTGWQPAADGWEDMAGAVCGTPSTVTWAVDSLSVFVRSVDGTISYKHRDPGLDWHPSLTRWHTLGEGRTVPFAGDPRAAVDQQGHIFVAAVELGGQVSLARTERPLSR